MAWFDRYVVRLRYGSIRELPYHTFSAKIPSCYRRFWNTGELQVSQSQLGSARENVGGTFHDKYLLDLMFSTTLSTTYLQASKTADAHREGLTC